MIDIDTSNFTTIVRERAYYQPDNNAYTFLLDGEYQEATLSYGELDLRARGVAALLQSLGEPGKRVLLLYPAGLDFIIAFLGCLYAGDIAIPLYVPRPKSMQRLRAVVSNSASSVALTTAASVNKLKRMSADHEDLSSLNIYSTDNIAGDEEVRWSAPAIAPDTLAFLQYTSGTTGTPKGVMVSHGNLVYNSRYIYTAMSHSPESKIVTWLPPFHDMGLIYGLLQPLYGGFPCIVMTPSAFVQRPVRWLEAISRYRATSSAAPNFAYDLCVEKVAPEQLSALDLSSWCVAVNGAEPIRWSTLENFSRKFAECGFRRTTFYPGYGLAETTLQASGVVATDLPTCYTVLRSSLLHHRVTPAAEHDKDALTLVSCGRAWLDEKIVIADPEKRTRCEPEQVGEIWISSPSNARGYWNRPQESAETFHAYLTDTGEGPFLRTGDLGFLKGEDLFVTGRRKDLIIINGVNYYPQDIEQVVEESHPSICKNGCAAFAVERDGREQLVVMAELERYDRSTAPEDSASSNTAEYTSAALHAIIETCSNAVADQCEIPISEIVLIKPKNLPKTTSGKIQRSACREAFLSGALEEKYILSSQLVSSPVVPLLSSSEDESLDDILPRTPVEQILARIWSEVLGYEPIGINQDFFELGGDSTSGMQVVARAAAAGLQFTPWELFEQRTIAKLAAVVQHSEAPSSDEPQTIEVASSPDFPMAQLNRKDINKLLQKLSTDTGRSHE